MFFDDFDDLFSKAWNNFQRPVKDMEPFRAFAVEKGYLVVVNTLGIDKSNLSITLEKEKGRAYPVLKVVGETNLAKINFKNSVNLGISLKIDDEITGLSYASENGLTRILIETKKPERKAKTFNAKLIEDDGSLDF